MRRVFAAAAALLALAACPSAFGEVAAGARSAGDGWIVQVSVEPSEVGPLVISVTSVRRVEAHDPQVWIQHELVLENRSDRRITFADTWRAAVLGRPGRPMLVASADQRCGYARVRPLRATCILPLDFPVIRAHGRLSRAVTLWKGLRGATPPADGTYVFRQPLRFQPGRNVPEAGSGRTVTLELVYRITAW